MNERNLDYYSDVLTPDEAAKVLHINKFSIYKLLQNGEIKSFKVGKLYRIPKKHIQSLIESCYNDDCE